MEKENDKQREVLRLLSEHNAMIGGYLYAMAGDWHVVEDALQDTAVYVCTHWNDFELGTNFGAWARTIATHCCRSIMKRRRREGKRFAAVQGNLAEAVPSTMWDQESRFGAEEREALTQCLGKLSGMQRFVFNMFYAHGRKCEEIASVRKQKIGSVYGMLSKIRKALRLCVEKRISRKA